MLSYSTPRPGWRALATAALCAIAALVAPPPTASAAGTSPYVIAVGFKYKEYIAHYDVNADGTFRLQRMMSMVVLNENGVMASRQYPISLIGASPGFSLDLETLEAYTLKKNGERIAAVSASAPPDMPTTFAEHAKFLAFPRAEIGDVLVVSYKAVQKKTIAPGNFVVDEMFQKTFAYDHAEIIVTTPASMKLRANATWGAQARRTTSGQLQTLEWTYQNTPPVEARVDVPAPPNMLHVTNFADVAAEAEAYKKQFFASPAAIKAMKDLNPSCGDVKNALASYTQMVKQLFWTDGKSLESLINQLAAPDCIAKDGRHMLMAMGWGYNNAFSEANDWDKGRARIEELKTQFPGKPFVTLAEVHYWIAYSWDARGGGYASSVSNEGFKLMHERLEKAEKILLDTKPQSSQLPDWYDQMIDVQSLLDRPEDERDRIFLEGVKRYPGYQNTYFTMVNYLMPKWGGTWRTVDNMVLWSVDHTRAKEGTAMYARLYWFVDESNELALFKETFASWPKMRQGFQDLMTRHPESNWNLVNFARFACKAEDKNAFLELRHKIEANKSEEFWSGKPSLELCDAKFGYES